MAWAGGPDPLKRERAIAEICQLYWPPIFAFIRSWGHSKHDAEDLTQGFFAHFLKQNRFSTLDRTNGKLRSYLLGAVKNFLKDVNRREQALKRGKGVELVPMNADEVDAIWNWIEANPAENPDRLFDKLWALQVLEAAVHLLEQRYLAKGQGELFSVLLPLLQAGENAPDLIEIADRTGMSHGAVRVAAHRLRQRYGQVLRGVVAETIPKGENPKEEISELMAAFA